jgi:hypothetical protein
MIYVGLAAVKLAGRGNPRALDRRRYARASDMKLAAQRKSRMQRPASLLEWNRWFAWHPIPLVIDGKLHYAWLQTVERKWGTSRYRGVIKWRYRLPARSRSR